MSHRRVQQLAVLLLHDPELVRRLHEDPEGTLAGEELTARERRWLLDVDPRAWGTDPLRADRLLTGLMEEFPTSCRAVLGEAGGLEHLRSFFRSAPFRDCITERGSLAASFETYLRSEGAHRGSAPVELQALARVEGAMARIRRRNTGRPPRAVPVTASEDRLHLGARVELLDLPRGTLACFRDASTALATAAREAGSVVAALLDSPPSADRGVHLDPTQEEALLAEGRADGTIGLAPLPEGLAALLRRAEAPVSRATLEALARNHGADPGEEAEILDGLVADGLLEHSPC